MERDYHVVRTISSHVFNTFEFLDCTGFFDRPIEFRLLTPSRNSSKNRSVTSGKPKPDPETACRAYNAFGRTPQ